MPKVGKKKFPYTKKGKQAAKKYAKKTGRKVSNKRDLPVYLLMVVVRLLKQN